MLPEEDADEFAALEAAMVEELAPVGALQAVLARRVAVAAAPRSRRSRPNFADGRGMVAKLIAVSRSRASCNEMLPLPDRSPLLARRRIPTLTCKGC